MGRTSTLYRNLGWSGPGSLFAVGVSGASIPDGEIISINTHRGGSDPSKHAPSTGSVHTTRRVGLDTLSMSVDLSVAGAAHIASRCYVTDPASIQIRMFGRRGSATAHDRAGRGWTSTEVTTASWDSVLKRSPDTHTPQAGTSLAQAITGALNPTWAPAWTSHDGSMDQFFADGDPMTAADVISLLESRLYLFVPTRDGRLFIRALATWEAKAAAATTAWPLSRSQVLAPTTWEQPADQLTEYHLERRTTTGTTTIITSPTGAPSPDLRPEVLDWLNTISVTDQWRRVYGLRAMTWMTRWQLPKAVIRLDKLIGSALENNRRTAGMLLALEVGDTLPLAGDWPGQLTGLAYVASIDEQITHAGWTMTLGLLPYTWLAGQPSPTPKPRTWAQTRAPWDEPTQTWQEGPNR